MIRQTFVALTMLLGSTAAFAQSAPVKLDAVAGIPAIDNRTQTEDIKFKTGHDDRLTVPVRLGGRGRSASSSTPAPTARQFRASLPDRLGLARGDDASLHTVTGVSMVSTADVPDLELTRKPVKIMDAAVLDSANIGADGIIGVDSLRSKRVQFDFETETCRSSLPRRRTSAMSRARSWSRAFDGTAGSSSPTRTANGHALTVVIDTGAQVSIGNEALREKLVGRDLIDPLQKVELQSVTGAMMSGDYMFVREIEIGGIEDQEPRHRLCRCAHLQEAQPRPQARAAPRNERDPRLQEGVDRFREQEIPRGVARNQSTRRPAGRCAPEIRHLRLDCAAADRFGFGSRVEFCPPWRDTRMRAGNAQRSVADDAALRIQGVA